MLLKKSSPEAQDKIKNMLYLSYLSHIEFRLYEDLKATADNPNRFRLELAVSAEFDREKECEEVILGNYQFTID